MTEKQPGILETLEWGRGELAPEELQDLRSFHRVLPRSLKGSSLS